LKEEFDISTALFGMFMSSADTALDDKFLRLSVREQATITAKDIGRKALSSAKTFGVLSAVFVSTECITESIRGKDDMYNGVISGCVTGAILSRSGTAVFCSSLLIQSLTSWSASDGTW
jgi:hypothetical protein